MGLTTWENAPDGKIVKTDVSIAKNYLKGIELEDMGRLVNAVLDMAERMAKRHIPMTMEDWAKRIDLILEASGDAILTDAGKVTAEFAKKFAEAEFENTESFKIACLVQILTVLIKVTTFCRLILIPIKNNDYDK